MKNISAPLIITNTGKEICNGWLSVTDEGIITSVNDSDAPVDAKFYNGVIIPGFINSHCHLELSHLHKQITKGCGMPGFIKQILRLRNFQPNSDINQVMLNAQYSMIQNGIVAVGDISNNTETLYIKSKKDLYYHTFIEILGMDPSKANDIYKYAEIIYNEFEHELPGCNSITPHAPYSVSTALFDRLSIQSATDKKPHSIHLHESQDELLFFSKRTGGLAEIFSELDFNFSYIPFEENKSPLETIFPYLKGSYQYVHNVYTTQKDLDFISALPNTTCWCFCPNANLYISGTLPDFGMFYRNGVKCTIGTDSLASNDQLCILSELKIISKACPEIPFTELIKWSTLNGSAFLQIDHWCGSIKPGMKPGLNLLENINTENPVLTVESRVTKII